MCDTRTCVIRAMSAMSAMSAMNVTRLMSVVTGVRGNLSMIRLSGFAHSTEETVLKTAPTTIISFFSNLFFSNPFNSNQRLNPLDPNMLKCLFSSPKALVQIDRQKKKKGANSGLASNNHASNGVTAPKEQITPATPGDRSS